MNLSVAHLGPPGNYSEQAALFYINWLETQSKKATLCPYPSIAQSLKAVATESAMLAVVPAENSIEGSVTMTMDTMWQLDSLHIQLALVMPIVHTLISCTSNLDSIKTVYSHPQALAQCQGWLERFLPEVQLIPTNSTTETLQKLESLEGAATISSQRAAQLYNLPILAAGINDHPDNCTRFWVVSLDDTHITSSQDLRRVTNKRYTSLAFSLRANTPGALFKALGIFAELNINLSRIESRPTKRSLGEYLFFIDLEADVNDEVMQSALQLLSTYTEVLKIFGSYNVFSTKDM